MERFNDLYLLWFEAQREFADLLDDFRQNFKLILEGEQAVESAKADYEAVEHREHKLAKDLKKLSKKAGNSSKEPPQETVIQLRDLQHKLDQASKANCTQCALGIWEDATDITDFIGVQGQRR